jgi:lysyl-tRNA synthetase class 2
VLRPRPRGDRLPPLVALAVAAAGLVNALSALTPNIGWEGRAVLQLEPVRAVLVFHTLALPASAALVLMALYVARRRRRAWQTALVFLLILTVVDVLKGLDLEEALFSAAVAALLWWGRAAFYVRHEPIRVRSAGSVAAGIGVGAFALAVVAALAVAPDAHAGLVAREAGDLLVWRDGPIGFHDELFGVPLAVGLVSAFALVSTAYLLFRPLAAPRSLPSPELRRAAAGLVRRHGTDTLAYFKLRRDSRYLFSEDGRAFVLLVSGDPVGPAEALPELIREARSFAGRHGLSVAALGASEQLLSVWREAGFRALYIGDEALVDTQAFSLEGRAIRKVRQSVSRLERAGFRAEPAELRALCDGDLAELESVSDLWRAGSPERGFTMAMDSLRCDGPDDGLLVVARDCDGHARGFLHFVPVYGRPAMSLSAMRRDRSTPNGLTEFLVARAIELLRERGIDEVSLNFAAFARLLYGPCNRTERLLGRIVGLFDPYFQIESLYRFNAKFSPRWEPRYLVFEWAGRLPRVGLAAMWIEGQLRRPVLR